jgi:hypothetical protein
MVLGPVLLVVYNLEWFGGRLHTDLVFALMWGGFPVITSYFAQAERIDGVAIVGAAAATLLSLAQRHLSTPARALRRRTIAVEGTITFDDGSSRPLDIATLLRPLELALHALSWGLVALAIAVSAARFR